MEEIKVTPNKSLLKKIDEQKPSKLQWVPLVGIAKLMIDEFKGKFNILDYRDDESRIKRIIPELHAMYQGMSAFVFIDSINKYFS